jgi:hypothetical protein
VVLEREVTELCAARLTGRLPKLPDLPVQYADYAVWQRERLTDAVVAYWRSTLAGVQTLDLPTDRPRPPPRGTVLMRVAVLVTRSPRGG